MIIYIIKYFLKESSVFVETDTVRTVERLSQIVNRIVQETQIKFVVVVGVIMSMLLNVIRLFLYYIINELYR